MAIRELYSNCKDEGGEFFNDGDPIEEYHTESGDTAILIPECSKLKYILENWSQYFIESEPVYETPSIKIYDNNLPGKPYTIYKNGVMVYSDSRRTSMYVYDHSNAEIDEMRVLRNKSHSEIVMSYAIRECTSSDFISKFIDDFAENPNVEEKHLIGYGIFSSQWVEMVNFQYEQKILKPLPQPMYEDMLSDSRFILGKKSLASALYEYSPKIDVEIVTNSVPSETQDSQLELIPLELTFNERVIKICKSQNVEVIYPIVESIIKNYCKVISDMSEKVLHVDSEFSEDNVWEIVKEQFRMQSNEKSDRDLIYKEYLKLLNK
jgi:virulence-associated protein VagC